MLSRRKELRKWIEQLPKTKDGELKYGRPMSSGDLASRLMRDYQRLITSLADQVSRSLVDHEILVAVTDRPVSNAWAFRNAFKDDNTSVVLVTKDLIQHVQSISTGTSMATLVCLATEESPLDIFRVWRDLPRDKVHADAFGRLMGHVTIALLMNHEFAHIIMGHGVGAVGCVDELANAEKPALDTYVYTPAPVVSAGQMLATSSAFDRSQCYELDADSHALLWTREYVSRFNPESPSIIQAPPEDRRVIEAILGNSHAARFLVLVSSWALFFVLGARPFDISRLSQGTHPQVGMRLALMTYAELQLEAQQTKGAEIMPEVARYAALVGQRSFVGIESPDQIFDLIGYKAALENWEAVTKHAEYLGTRRYLQEALLSRYRIKSSLPGVNWWGTPL